MKKIICSECEKEVKMDYTHQKTCLNKECQKKRYAKVKKNRKPHLTGLCIKCGVSFKTKRYGQNYCSRRCNALNNLNK